MTCSSRRPTRHPSRATAASTSPSAEVAMHTLPARTLWMCSLIPAVLLAAVCAVAPPAAARLDTPYTT